MNKTEILNRVDKVNDQLLSFGYSWVDILIFWDDCISIARERQQSKYAGFNYSLNSEKLAKKLNSRFSLNFQPKIKRQIDNKTGVKFLMITTDNKIYDFKGTVFEFLSHDIEIELVDQTFILK